MMPMRNRSRSKRRPVAASAESPVLPADARNRLRRSGWLICVWLTSLPCGALAEDNPDPALETQRQELKAIEEKVRTVSKDLVGQREDRRALIAELEARERNVAELALSNRELQKLVREAKRTASELRDRQADERHALRRELDLLAELVRTAYVMGRADQLRLLLNQEDPAQASRVMSYFSFFNRERMKRIQAVRQLAERLAALAREAEAEASRFAELAISQEATRQRLEIARQDRAQVLQHLEASIATQSETLDGLEKDAESLRILIDELRKRAQIRAELDVHRDAFPARKGRLAWPVLEGRILSKFGSRKDDSATALDGVLLSTREGEEVRTVNDGRVVYADWLRGFGLLMVIDHGDGFMSLYGHNQALLRDVGEWVATGDVIALSGNSGGQTEPGLYFAIRRNGRPQDPAEWCGRSVRESRATRSPGG